MIDVAGQPARIYLRQSDFRDEDDQAGALAGRADELRELAAALGVVLVDPPRVENDIDGNGRLRGVSGFKTPDTVLAASGLVERRTRRPEWTGTLLDLQAGIVTVLLVADESRLTRDWRDGKDLVDVAKARRASVVAPDDDGGARWILTAGGTRDELRHFSGAVDAAYRFSLDHGARISKGRKRWAGKSWQGGPRPWGFQPRPGTERYARTLDPDAAEAAVANDYADRLLAGTSLKTCIADLRARQERGEPGCDTVSGSPWGARSLVGVLTKATIAGLQVKGGVLVEAPWEAVIEREKWERLRALLRDPARRVQTGTEPRWLVSSTATCGVCGKVLRIGGPSSRSRQRAHASYVGQSCGHIRRDAVMVDKLVTEAVLRLLARPEVLERARPPKPPDVDVAALSGQLADVARQRADWERRAIAGASPESVARILEGLDDREAAIRGRMAASAVEPDVLARFRREPARLVWDSMDMSLRRAVVRRLCEAVVIHPSHGRRFDPTLIEIRPRADLAG
jgi:hypothetical protein